MSNSAFKGALPFILRWEGGYVNHPADPGGPTNKGVTQKVYDQWRKQRGQATRSVKFIDNDEVAAIYQDNYWMPPRCDLLESQLDLVQFDTAVNMGVGRAVRFLQQTLGCSVDGKFGPTTVNAVASCDAGQAIAKYCDVRERFYRNLAQSKPTLKVFLKGWLNRLNALRHEVGLPGFEAAPVLDFGDTGHIAKVPDIGEDPAFDL